MPAGRIPIPELKKKLETNKKLVVVDVREPKEIKEGGKFLEPSISRWLKSRSESANSQRMPKSFSIEVAAGARRALLTRS